MTTPVYNSQIPQPENSIDQGQTDFLNNFSTLFNAFSSDHVPLDSGSNPGNHTFARLTEVETGQATGASEIALYSKNVERQTDQLFFRGIGNSQEIQYSNYQNYSLQPIKQGNNIVQNQWFSFIPGGIIIYFGFITPTSNTFKILLDPPIARNILSVNLGRLNQNTNIDQSNVAAVPNPDGTYSTIQLTTRSTSRNIPPQGYIIYGAI